MESNRGELTTQVKKTLSGLIIQSQRLGKSESAFWIETAKVREAAERLKASPELAMDWLEDISVMELEGALVLTWIVRSSTTGEATFLRGSLVPKNASTAIEVPSVSGIWAMASPCEAEAGELFGIRFLHGAEPESAPQHRLLPDSWNGFPLRKSYVFPSVVDGIRHSRDRE